MNTEEIRTEILSYFGLDQRIEFFDSMRQTVEKEYYASHSFTGGMMWDQVLIPYQRTLSVENHALTLYAMTKTLDAKLNKLRDRYRHFQSYLETIDVVELKTNLMSRTDELTELEKATYAEIGEIEQYIKFKYINNTLQYQSETDELEENGDIDVAELQQAEESIFSKLRGLFE